LFSLSGFHVRDVFEAYESQFLGIEAVPVTGEVGAGDLHRDIEETQRLVNHFSERCRTKIRQWRDALDRLQDGNKRVVMWGAGARTVGFVNGLGITDQIPYAVDINPRKAGKYLPGTGQEIVSPDFLKTYRPDVIIVMNAIYQAEIERDIRRMGLDVEYMIA
jgi:hypothetical protein